MRFFGLARAQAKLTIANLVYNFDRLTFHERLAATGQSHDVQGFAPLFRMITDRIEAFLADGGYDADAIRTEIEAAGVEAAIPAKVNRRDPVPHDGAKYKWRDLIKRLFCKLKNWWRVATRYDKTKESYLGFVALASVKLWIPFVHGT